MIETETTQTKYPRKVLQIIFLIRMKSNACVSNNSCNINSSINSNQCNQIGRYKYQLDLRLLDMLLSNLLLLCWSILDIQLCFSITRLK